MYKHIELLGRRDGATHESFLADWQRDYVPQVTALDEVVRYQQVIPTEPDHAEFDGISELYFETRTDREAVVGRRGADGGTAALAGPDVLSVAVEGQFAGEETVQRDDVDGDTDGLYKHSAFLVRTEGMSHDEFVEYWQENHTPVARKIEGVVKYDTVVPADPESSAFDGVAELYFEDLADLTAALGSEGSRDYDPTRERAMEAREDVDNFLAIDERPRLIGRNYLLKGER
jgi:uncharacterized protein (TIGR02118 family)